MARTTHSTQQHWVMTYGLCLGFFVGCVVIDHTDLEEKWERNTQCSLLVWGT